MVRVALTGTPGVGKTTVAAVARGKGWRVVDVKEWARSQGCVVAHDEADAADVIDVGKLSKRVPRDDGSKVLYEGHLSHLLGLDMAWVIRCDPRVLRGRLVARDYKAAKVLENLEAEALDIILQESLAQGMRVVQRDGTRRTAEGLFQSFDDAGLAAAKADDLEEVDWSSRLPIS